MKRFETDWELDDTESTDDSTDVVVLDDADLETMIGAASFAKVPTMVTNGNRVIPPPLFG